MRPECAITHITSLDANALLANNCIPHTPVIPRKGEHTPLPAQVDRWEFPLSQDDDL
jgi:hypothetical protein